MAFYFQPGDFQMGEQSLYPLQYSPALTGQDLYNHIQQQIGSACQIMIENSGQWVQIDPQWIIGQCFVEGDYQLAVFINGVPQPEQPQQNQQNANTDGPKTISAHVYINSEYINEIAVPIEASLLQIVQQIELPPGQGLLSYGLYDATQNLIIQDQDPPMVQMLQQSQPLILNITTQPTPNQQVQQQGFGEMSQRVPETQEVMLNVFLNGELFQQISAPAISSIVEIIQQIQFAPGQAITNYGLYDSTGSPLSIDTDAQLNSFAQQPKPFSLNITTVSQQVQVYILLNGVQYNFTDYSADTSLSQIVNQAQLSQGQTMQQYILYDSQGIVLIENKDVILKQFSTAQQPFTLNIITSMGNQIKYSGGQQLAQQFPLNAQSNLAPQANKPFAPPGFPQQVPPPQQPLPVQPAPQIQQQPQPQIPEPQKLTAKERAKQAMQELKILKKFSLLIDLEGEFVIFKYHLPVMVQGVLRKETSSEKKSFKKERHTWDTVNKVKYAETGDYAFAIEWDNGYISKFKLNLL